MTKDERLAALWPSLVVTEDSLVRCVSEIRSELGAQGAHWLKTLPKRGHMFDIAVTALADDDPNAGGQQTVPMPPPDAAPPRIEPRRALGIGMALTLLLAMSASYWVWSAREKSVSPRLSLVVLPFVAEGMQTESRPTHLADALSEDLTLALARLPGATVISSASALTYKDRPST